MLLGERAEQLRQPVRRHSRAIVLDDQLAAIAGRLPQAKLDDGGATGVLEHVVEHLVERRLEQRGVAPDVGGRVELKPQLHARTRHPFPDALRRGLSDPIERDAHGEGQLERKA